MQLKNLLTAALLTISFTAFAQSITIKGIIRDVHTQEPVSYASVYMQVSGIGKTSDSSGNFTLRLNNLTADTLVVSYIGYQVFKIPVNQLNDTATILIELKRGNDNAAVIVKKKFNKILL